MDDVTWIQVDVEVARFTLGLAMELVRSMGAAPVLLVDASAEPGRVLMPVPSREVRVLDLLAPSLVAVGAIMPLAPALLRGDVLRVLVELKGYVPLRLLDDPRKREDARRIVKGRPLKSGSSQARRGGSAS